MSWLLQVKTVKYCAVNMVLYFPVLVTFLEKMTDPNKALPQAALTTVKCWCVVVSRILQKAEAEPGVTYQ